LFVTVRAEEGFLIEGKCFNKDTGMLSCFPDTDLLAACSAGIKVIGSIPT
jgi:hypothetical protein